jgi:hypothetical protein
MLLHQKQREAASSDARFKIIRAGRKGGKTALEVETLCFKALVSIHKLGLPKTTFATGRKVIYIAPTQDQARNIVWEALKTRLTGIGTPNEQQLKMRVRNEDGEVTTIFVGGYENRENYRGLTDVIHITFDEVDTLKDFFISWREIFRPMFLDTAGTADFIGTPKKENPNLRRLEKEADAKENWATFHFTSKDNPHLPLSELTELEKEYGTDRTTYRQEILAEYVENEGALFKFTALIDLFTNTITKTPESYLVVDIADDGSDKTIFTPWKGLEAHDIEVHAQLQTDGIIQHIRELAALYQVPYSQIAVDAIGVGAGVASSPLLTGVVGFKSSYGPMRTDLDPVRLPNVHYLKNAPLTSEYKNLRSQCVFTLASLINDHQVAVKVDDQRIKSSIIEELSTYQDASTGDGKRMATMKEDVKELIGRSPDLSDTLIMRMYFVLKGRLTPAQDPTRGIIHDKILQQFRTNERNFRHASNK